MLVQVLRDGRAAVRRFTRLVEEAREPARTAAEDVERFDALIRSAVERHMLADVPVGVFLSGGIDSSIVARAARDVAGSVSTFSIAFDDPTFDESRWFEMAARAIGSDHHTERLRSQDMAALLPGIAEVASEPLADGSIFPTMLLSKFTRQHVKVVLSGDGADELFAGYPTHRVIRAGTTAAMLPGPIRRGLLSAAHRVLPVSRANLSFDYRVKKFLEGADRDPVTQNERWLASFQPEDLPHILTSFDPSAQERLADQWHEASRTAGDALEAVLRTDRRFYLQDGVLVKVDRASMHHSLEVRVPMLDPAMVRFANGLPRDRKIRGRRSKWLLREWARRHFPAELAERPKKGFGAPLAEWFRGDLRELVRDTLSTEAIARQGLFRASAVQRLLDDHERGRRDERKRIFNLLMFTLWHQRWAG
jgi:asparagine synthase (glutamine-hydrolysing)